MIDAAALDAAAALLAQMRARHWMLATAESCTGGLITAALTHVPGSSDVVDRGFVTYSNEAKMQMLGVPAALIEAHGAVSEPVAAAMAEGTLAHSRADIAISVTGVAGPGGGSPEKPVGLVWFGCATRGNPAQTMSRIFPGDRASVRAQTVAAALAMIAAAA